MNAEAIVAGVGIVISLICGLIVIIHRQGMQMLKDIKQGVDKVNDKADKHETRISRLEAEAKTCTRNQTECEQERESLHKRITKSQGAV